MSWRPSPIRNVAFIACCAEKATARAPARELYRSPLFRLSLAYAEKVLGAEVRILSAKHGLVAPDQELEPYDLTLRDFEGWELADWRHVVEIQVADFLGAELHPERDEDGEEIAGLHFYFLHAPRLRLHFLAGELYRFEPPRFNAMEEPLKGLGIGRRLSWLKSRVSALPAEAA